MKLFCKSWKSGFVLASLGLACFSSGIGYCAEEDNTHAVTPERIEAMPKTERKDWQTYYDRSQAHLKADKAFLAAEVKAQGLTEPIPAPNGDGFRILRQKPVEWLGSDEAKAFADACVSFQTPSGGWSKGVAFNSGLRRPAMHWTNSIGGWYYVGTFDNNANNAAMTSLAKIYNATKNPKYSAAFLKGLDYIFDAQFPNGGWPQNYPLVGWYHDEITYNDDAMTNVVGLLRDVAKGQGDYGFVDEARRNKAKVAMEAGLNCILKTQVVQNGKLTAWCAQHDPLTLEIAPARKFEVASLSGGESANVVRFLMSIEPPSPQVKNAVNSAVEWFNSVKINGYEITSSLNEVGGRVFILQPNPNAGPLWGRFYEIGTNRPMFVTRETKVFYNLSDLDQSGPNKGYNWYVNAPQKMLENEYPKWLAKWGKN